MRCVAHLLPADLYDQMEAHLVSGLRDYDRDTLLALLYIEAPAIELLSGEWRRLFATAKDYRKILSPAERRARLLVQPENNADFLSLLRGIEESSGNSPLVLGAAKLLRLMQSAPSTHGIVFIEEDQSWEQEQHRTAIMAMRPEVFGFLREDIIELQQQRELSLLHRLFSDHCDAEIEFAPEGWNRLRSDAHIQAPELIAALDQHYTTPDDFTIMRELLGVVGSAQTQPSLDSWLRVHGDAAQYALFFHTPQAKTK